MSSQPKMICPNCGREMNQHAEKLIDASPGEADYNLCLGGVLEQSHACPGCGTSAARRSAA